MHATLAPGKERSSMGVTAIKSIANRVIGVTYFVRNLENPNDTGGEGQYLGIGPGENRPVNMWIPWCDNQVDFRNGKRITLEAVGTIESGNPDSFTIWQSGNYVYFSLDDMFESGQLVAGNSTINGDRSVEITSAGVRFY